MKVLITGATGLIGSELVSLLLQNGISVNYLSTSKKKIVKKLNYNGFYWSPERGYIDENCLIGVDSIINLAGANIAKRWTNSYKQEILESRLLSSALLYKALKNNPNQVKQIVTASGTSIYPNSDTIIYDENSTQINDSFLGNVVVKWEESTDKFASLGLKVCKLRTGIVLSSKGGALVEMLKTIKLGLGASFGSGKQIQSWIHIHDIAALYLFAIKNDLDGVYNAVSPNPVTNEELTLSIAKVLKKPIFMPNIPKFVMKLVLGEMHELLFENRNLSAKKIEEKGFEFKYLTIDKALNNILL
ncbi:MAG: TIGR01777 family protein [Flavobacteriaceae bacterium]|nr:TIGR01777 family protein [Flavobacteriaceae bacterium]